MPPTTRPPLGSGVPRFLDPADGFRRKDEEEPKAEPAKAKAKTSESKSAPKPATDG